jgi:hypothetical protein
MKRSTYLTCILTLSLGLTSSGFARTFYIDSVEGNNTNDGQSEQTAFQTLSRAGEINFTPGDQVLLKSGCTFKTHLKLRNVSGSKDEPIIISSFGAGALPIIDPQGYLACIDLLACSHFQISNLELRNHAEATVEEAAKKTRMGIYIHTLGDGVSEGISLKDLKIHSIFADELTPSEGANKEASHGYGIFVEIAKQSTGSMKDMTVDNCSIGNTGYLGLQFRGQKGHRIENIKILNNKTLHTGATGILVCFVKDVLIKGNVTNFSGSNKDPRMHGRGSGSWTFAAENVLYEQNAFMNAQGKADSAGVHIDFACTNVIVQRCFSYNNAGGFAEILGDNYNCCYRYNISVNDGYRVKGKHGASQEGKLLWTSGHCTDSPKGPYNSYIYNNTIYTKEDIVGKFSFVQTTSGILIANNIFHITGKTKNVGGDQKSVAKWKRHKELKERLGLDRIEFKNNLYLREDILPKESILQDAAKLIGNANFTLPGGKLPRDYIPRNTRLIKDQGIIVTNLPDDKDGLLFGEFHATDFFGHPILGKPDLGAIEIK